MISRNPSAICILHYIYSSSHSTLEKKAIADSSLYKCGSLPDSSPQAMNTKKAANIQPTTAWFTSLTTNSRGISTALLIIKIWDKVAPISLISPNADQADAYKIQAIDDLSLSSPEHTSPSWAPPSSFAESRTKPWPPSLRSCSSTNTLEKVSPKFRY
jgi:hypothetical protein